MLFMSQLVGVPRITLGGQTDEEIIGNLVSMIGYGLLIAAALYLFMRFYLPGALKRKEERLRQRGIT